MVRYISLLLAGTSCAVVMTAGVADSRGQSSPQMYINPHAKQPTAELADSPGRPDGGEQNESGQPTKAIEANALHRPSPGGE